MRTVLHSYRQLASWLRSEWLVILAFSLGCSAILVARSVGWPDAAAVPAGAVVGVLTVRLIERGEGPRP